MNTIRVWKDLNNENVPWHVSIGDATPLGELRQMVERHPELIGETVAAERFRPALYGMAWDEALAQLALFLIAPGAVGPVMRYSEPPIGGGWALVLELVPTGPCEWRVRSATRDFDRLQYGEALATFVHETYNREWRGFMSERRASFALARREVVFDDKRGGGAQEEAAERQRAWQEAVTGRRWAFCGKDAPQ